jgi:hypothetical protein
MATQEGRTERSDAHERDTAPARLVVYGVTRAGFVLPDRARLRLLEEGPLAAVVADAGARSTRRAHAAVMDALAAAGTIVPLGFGTILDERAARELLRHERDALASVLDRLDGCVQMTLEASYVDDRAAEPERRRQTEEQRMAHFLAGVCEQVAVELPAHEREAVRLRLLVRRDHRAELDEAVEGLRVRHAGRLAIHYAGPTAPYSFSDFSDQPAAA